MLPGSRERHPSVPSGPQPVKIDKRRILDDLSSVAERRNIIRNRTVVEKKNVKRH